MIVAGDGASRARGGGIVGRVLTTRPTSTSSMATESPRNAGWLLALHHDVECLVDAKACYVIESDMEP